MLQSHQTSSARKTSTLVADQLQVDDRTVVVGLEGELDLWSAPHLKSVLSEQLAAGRTRLVLDLEHVPFMDSTALGVMVGVHRRLGAGERMAIAAPAPPVLRIFELSGLATGFPVFANRASALDYVSEEDAQVTTGTTPPLTADAALMLGIASTAMPFALSAEDQAERWLRALRNHGEAGVILASLGLSEGALDEAEHDVDGEPSAPLDADVVASVAAAAGEFAAERAAPKLGTIDLLNAVMRVYGSTFYRVLAAHGVDRAELTARMTVTEPDRAEI